MPKKYQDHFPCSFAYKLFSVDNHFSKLIVLYRGENAAYKFIEAILKGFNYCKKVMEKHFNKNLILAENKKNNFNQLTRVGFVKNSLKMTK